MRSLPEHLWKGYCFAESVKKVAMDELTFEDLLDLTKDVSGQEFVLNEDQSVHSSYSVEAVKPSLFSKTMSFANSLLGPSYNYEPPMITFEGGFTMSNAFDAGNHYC